MLDEPTNDLDVNTLRALEDAWTAFAGCAIIVSHDRWFLDRIATHILAFEWDRNRRRRRSGIAHARWGRCLAEAIYDCSQA
jgi:ATPase subunit of ABC transporter with duplicated ATPase domains